MSPGPFDLQLVRLIDAPPALVWQALTTPEILRTWWSPAPVRTVEVEMDVRPGGIMRTLMIGPNGERYPTKGVFVELVPNERLVWTDALEPDGRPAAQPFMTGVFTLTEERGKTRYVATALHRNAEDMETHKAMGFEAGWGAMLDQFETAIALLKAGTSEAARSLELTRLIPAKRGTIWRAFTDPAELPNWWGPSGFSCETKEIDLRASGLWRFDMIGPDGKRWPNRIRYREFTPMDRIEQDTDDDGTGSGHGFRSIATLEDEGEGTRVTLRLVFATAEEASGARVFVKAANGASTLEKLERWVVNRD